MFAIFSNVTLVSNDHGSKGGTIHVISHCSIEITHKTVKPSHSQKS